MLYVDHWDHVMTYPEACEHAMQVIQVHMSQVKTYQTDLEAYLAQINAENQWLELEVSEQQQVNEAHIAEAEASKK